MSHHQINTILRYMRASLYSLFILLFFLGSYFLYLMVQSFHHLNDNAISSSRTVSDSVFYNERESLGKVVYDYSFWNDAAEALSGVDDTSYYEDNFDSDYLFNTFNINQVIIYKRDGNLKDSIVNGVGEEVSSPVYTEPAFARMFDQAIQTDYESPEPITSYISISGQIHVIAASAIVPDKQTDTLNKGQLYGVLMMTRQLDKSLLNKWERQFHLNDLSIQTSKSLLKKSYIAKDITDIEGNVIALAIWKPHQPGKQYITEILPITGIIILCVVIILIVFSTFMNKYIRHTMSAARQLENHRDELQQLAHYDSVTKLPNRLLGMDRLEQAILASSRYGSYTALLFIDLDGFKEVNDSLGHDVGDELLYEIGLRLVSCVREGIDTVSRLGGDEFIVTLTQLQSQSDAISLAEDILMIIKKDIVINDKSIVISASIGIAISQGDDLDAKQMLKQADIAMYKAKLAGKNQFILADDEWFS
jgi:diguanylate cyclase (GGDEF)-like protein